ncbi:MAG: PAS domain-containing protein [Methanoregula sp.]|nr:PAS domain-containing protein [Methanoregula sp.]
MTTTTEPRKSVGGKTVEPVSPDTDLSNDILANLGTIIKASSTPQFLIDRNHRIIAWNRALEELTGIKEVDIVGTTQHWKAFYGVKQLCLADILVDESSGDLPAGYKHKCVGSVRADETYEATDIFPHLGYGEKWLHFTAVPIRDSNGTVIGSVESLEDVTEQKLLERALKLSNKKLHLMNSVAWHEIENKITGVRGYVELSKMMVKDETALKYFEAEENILKQVHELLEYTMDYQKIGALPLRWVNVRDTIRSIVSLMDIDSLCMDLDVDALELFGDPTLEIMFSFLVDNTLKNGKTAPEIRISSAEIPEGLQLTYENNSAGIPYSRKKNLFTEKIVKFDNFCMKFVHDILEFSGMSIKETGDPDKGIRFEILVPKGMYRFTKNP